MTAQWSCEAANILCNVIRMHCRDCGKHRSYCITHGGPTRANRCTCVEVPPEWVVTTYSPAPVEEKEGSEEPNPLVGEKAPDSAGATLMERLVRKWDAYADPPGLDNPLRVTSYATVGFFLRAVADEAQDIGRASSKQPEKDALYTFAHHLRTEASK